MPRGTKSYLHASNKKARRNFDAEKLDYIQKNLGLSSVREQTIQDERFIHKVRNPDLTVFIGKQKVLIELDSVKVHGELGFCNEKTFRRNRDYYAIDQPFCVVNEDLADILGLDHAKLANYLAYHAVDQFQALKGARGY